MVEKIRPAFPASRFCGDSDEDDTCSNDPGDGGAGASRRHLRRPDLAMGCRQPDRHGAAARGGGRQATVPGAGRGGKPPGAGDGQAGCRAGQHPGAVRGRRPRGAGRRVRTRLQDTEGRVRHPPVPVPPAAGNLLPAGPQAGEIRRRPVVLPRHGRWNQCRRDRHFGPGERRGRHRHSRRGAGAARGPAPGLGRVRPGVPRDVRWRIHRQDRLSGRGPARRRERA